MTVGYTDFAVMWHYSLVDCMSTSYASGRETDLSVRHILLLKNFPLALIQEEQVVLRKNGTATGDFAQEQCGEVTDRPDMTSCLPWT